MTSKLGIYTKPTHNNSWLDYARQLQPYDILILDPDIQQVSDAHQASPESEITIRRWDFDDGRTQQNPDGVYRMLQTDPESLANQHIAQFGGLITEWEQEARRRGIPFPEREQLNIHLINEPDSNYLMPQINRYTVVAAKGLRNQFGLTVDGFNLGTGHPATLNANHEPDWSPLAEALDVLAQTGGYAVCDEYFNDLGITDPSVNPWHVGRTAKWGPRGPKWKIGEFGLEMLVNNRAADHAGWQGIISPDQMVAATEWELANTRDDFVVVRSYMFDFEDRVWRTFDVAPIRGQLAALGQRYPVKAIAVDSQPSTIHLPSVGTGAQEPTGPTATPITPAGARIRSQPSVDSEPLGAVELGHAMPIVGRNADSTWYQVQSPFGLAWVSASVVKAERADGVPIIPAAPLVNPPQPTPADNWSRCLAWVRKWEGGFVNDPNDQGGATNKGITIGTFTSWRKAQGKPAPTVADLRALSDAEANQIYYDLYWLPSGADQLPYPLCLAHFNASVNAGTGRAKELLDRSGGNFDAYMGYLIQWYASLSDFVHFGVAWMRRCGDLLVEAA